ncbi:bifunctional D-glycero-beta-D-manno-heptose-7-phosphate kinase/D-glycero-beta-D-manno-heptose 1-phosphate adenylyltransferase HldE [Succinivibrio dextrinosolvens]|jgi:D-beta-D-heptose 7-phosphate kinase/D-beta-D-heptose 1-phosphate adenosyltransferase|uniref:bifunctional D-glycero-beta-D-manno-heptose-7-phosphate kinase/D-glycero-beta-D-manno-heptose 1-phosphate adenylyltransferase HldE n=1 Tax=Succinivibrio dextrinosolvens TaxID=83771 RepID=UPI00241E6329|nr:bifunctional D-glycero-beta-D-manno-heptose-7-phosphate kinase/D-glycero-beta-D-manno-heptose 1-phosphate adenylyltransferase HldE [Succinivibrio dextrinosolvens]MBE6422158.1 bifunctional D-glycero-beta-D-manno-heptose-7-phosphate kinase/D-glycero-beta-D-manno-heptose 1-phosphate adenylyltransferase HldE [Succinivibrio dextrinosolvens]
MNSAKSVNFTGLVTVVGDVMLDSYWKGPSNRISPEAPVPVVRVTDREERAGGAANVAINIASLGAPCNLVGIVGEDKNAEILEKIVRSHSIKTDFVLTKDHPTITKLRVLSRNQQLLRLDFEDSFSNLDEDMILKSFKESIKNSKVVIFSDYGKGSLASVSKMIEITSSLGIMSLIDPKGTDFEKYRGATLLTPNMSEFEAVVGKVANDDDLEQKALALINKLDLKMLLVTRSEDGMSLIRPGMNAVHLPTYAREVYDVTGAGDTVIGTLGTCLASGMDIVTSCEYANSAAGIVVGKIGTSTVSPQELESALGKKAESHGVLSEDELYKVVRELQSHGEKVVMTNGCFDIIHPGHVTYLKQAKALGSKLIVAVNSDDSVKRLKGDSRPINSLEDRIAVLSGLSSVDYVVSFSEDTPQKLISRILPDILVKGGDYKVEEIAGHKEVIANGGKVVIIPFVEGKSTTRIVNKIQNV